jgi:hypothetical protein
MGFDVGSVVAHIKADISDYENALKKAKEEASIFGQEIGTVASVLGKLTIAGTLAAVTIGTIFTKQSIDAAADAQVQVMKFNTIMKNSVGTTKAVSDAITKYSKTVTKLGFDDEEAALSTARFFQRTGDLTQSIMLNNIAMDLARDKNMSLTDAQRMVGLVQSGNGRILKQYGIDLKETATPMEAIIQLQGLLKDSAKNYSETYAGSMEVFKAEFTNFKEVIGSQLLPILTSATGKITEIIISAMAWEEKNHFVTNSINAVKDAIGNATEFYIAHKAEIDALVLALTAVFIPALIAVGIQMGINLVTSIANTTLSIITFAAEGWKAIAMIIVKTFQLGLSTAAFILDTAVTYGAAIATGVMTAATWLLNAALAVLTWPITLVIAAIVALIAIGWLLIANWDKVKAFGQAMLDFLVKAFWGFVDTLKNIGGAIFDAIKKPFEDAWNMISGIVNKIKDALDFTKRHSPSVVDIVNKGVNEVNRAMAGLDLGGISANINPSIVPAFSEKGGSSQIANVVVDMSGAYIGDIASATRYGEKIGDVIIKKLQKNVRF